MLKKIICILLLAATLFLLAACGDDEYPPVESTEEEARVVMTFSFEEETYKLKYELYRALFLNFKSEVDGGDSTVWSGENADKYIAEIDALIKDFASDIFAAFHIAKKIGKDPFSSEVDEQISEQIKLSVNGVLGSETIIGYGGDYNKYLEALKADNLNYSAHVTLLRYGIAYNSILEYYAGTINEDNPLPETAKGALEYTDADVERFYYSADCVRVLILQYDTRNVSKSRINEIRDTMASKGSEDAVSAYILGNTATSPEDAKFGMLIGKFSLDDAYYSEITEAAFTLSQGEVSRVIEVNDGETSMYYILYKAGNSTDFFEDKKDIVTETYVANEIGKIINEAKLAIEQSARETDILTSLDRAGISMQ